ncbi:hypothetical protein [Rhizobium etli]|nr:hypothetical protein [Rhizobium etli]
MTSGLLRQLYRIVVESAHAADIAKRVRPLQRGNQGETERQSR